MIDGDNAGPTPAKHAKTLAQVLKDDMKTECQDPSIISPLAALAATRPLNQLNQPIVKSEPDIFDSALSFEKTPSTLVKRTTNNSNQSTLLRSLIRTPQTPTLPTKKDAPLYDLLQNLDANDTSIFSTLNSTSTSSASTQKTNQQQQKQKQASLDPLEQYLTPAISQPTKSSTTKDDYLAALLSSDPQQPKEISFLPASKQRTPMQSRSASTSSDSSRIAAIVNDLFTSTTAAAAAVASTPAITTTTTTTNTTVNTSNDDFLSLLDNRDFLEVNLLLFHVDGMKFLVLVFK